MMVNLFWVTWVQVGGILIVLLVHKRRYDINTYQNKTNTYTDLLSHTQKEKFMVGFNYLERQIKRTKCASQEYAG